MHRVLLAGGAVLLQLETVGIVALVFEAVIIAVFAFRALERDLHPCGLGSHCIENSIQKNYTPFGA